MSAKIKKNKRVISKVFVVFFTLSLSYPVFAYVMNSSNYRVQSDSINIGGNAAQSSNYDVVKDTAGEVASGNSTSTTYKLKGGYQFMQEVFIGLTSPGNITMNNISMTQHTAIGTGNAWNVKTDNSGGYILSLNCDRVNCLYSGTNQFADYTEVTAGTPEYWDITSGDYEFGFSVYGSDVNTATWGSDSVCGTGNAYSNNLKYRGFASVTSIQVASSNVRTTLSGTDTILCVAAEQRNVYAPSGDYTSNVTGTAVSQ